MSKRNGHPRGQSRARDERETEGLEESQLRRLLTNTIDTIEDNKTHIFDIYQNTRRELERCRDDRARGRPCR